MSQRLFVYGTLKPGRNRWPLLERHLEPEAPVVEDQLEGQLWALASSRGWRPTPAPA